MKTIVVGGMILLGLQLGGCSVVSSNAQRAVATAAGAAAGGALANELSDRSVGWTVAGAGLGALATATALGKDAAAEQAGFENGYVQGQADAIKRQYFLRQALEADPTRNGDAMGKTVYYVVPGPQVTSDGRKLEPHSVTLSVTE